MVSKAPKAAAPPAAAPAAAGFQGGKAPSEEVSPSEPDSASVVVGSLTEGETVDRLDFFETVPDWESDGSSL
jgi:hypothetical protein